MRTVQVFIFLLSSLFIFAPSLAAQDLSRIRSDIASGNVELERNALFEIKNIRTAEASRLAVPALQDPNEMVRATAASAVAYLPQVEAAAALLPLLNDKAEFVRREAAYALGFVGDPSAVSALVRLIQRDADAVRNASIIAVGKIGDPAAIEPLNALLRKKPNEENEFQRRAAARSIGQIALFIRTGEKVDITPQNYLPSKFKEAAISTPTSALFRNSVTILLGVLKSRQEADDTRREAAFALGTIGEPAAIPALRAQLTSPDPATAEASKEALIRLGIPQ